MKKTTLFGRIPNMQAPDGFHDAVMEKIYADKYERKYRIRVASVAAVLLVVVFAAFFGYRAWYDQKHLVVLEFTYNAPDAADVRVTGDFSAWSTSGITLKKHNGLWSVQVKVPEGSYRYMFIVDGKTVLDPNAATMKDPFGDNASVKTADSGKEGI